MVQDQGNNISYPDFVSALQALKERWDLSQADLSRLMRKHATQISRYLSGGLKTPGYSRNEQRSTIIHLFVQLGSEPKVMGDPFTQQDVNAVLNSLTLAHLNPEESEQIFGNPQIASEDILSTLNAITRLYSPDKNPRQPYVFTRDGLERAGAPANATFILSSLVELLPRTFRELPNGFEVNRQPDRRMRTDIFQKLNRRVPADTADSSVSLEKSVVKTFKSLDMLLGGGIHLPWSQSPNVGVLVKGRSGLGKSMLSAQMAMGIARQGGTALYVLVEMDPTNLTYSAKALDWIHRSTNQGRRYAPGDKEWLWVEGASDEQFSRIPASHGALIVTHMPGFIDSGRDNQYAATRIAALVDKFLFRRGASGPNMLIIDPINLVVPSEPPQSPFLERRYLERLRAVLGNRAGLITVFTEEQQADGELVSQAEYLADLCISLKERREQDYLQRVIEITKMRFHPWPDLNGDRETASSQEREISYRYAMGEHIYRFERPEDAKVERPTDSGEPFGIKIYHSLHHQLSILGRTGRRPPATSPRRMQPLRFGIEGLDGGSDGPTKVTIEPGCLTALTGQSGRGKRFVAYSSIAYACLAARQNILLLSLRETPDVIKTFPAGTIRDNRFHQLEWDADPFSTCIRIIAESPGMISPEAFVSRFDAHLESLGSVDLVVLEGISQLPYRFPLVDQSSLIATVLVETCRKRNLPAIFSDVSPMETGGVVDKAIWAMADNIIEFLPPDTNAPEITPIRIAKSRHYPAYRGRGSLSVQRTTGRVEIKFN